MRAPSPERRRRGPVRPRLVLIIVAIIAFFMLTSMRGIAGFYTDYLWFKEVGYADVWRGLLLARIVPALVFTIVFFAIVLANLVIADRLAPRYRPVTGDEDLVERYRQVIGPYAGRVRIGVAAVLALIAGTGVSGQWREWLLFRNTVHWGATDPQFHRDIGFYAFRLPFLKFISEWAFAALLILLIVTALAHYLNGGIRPQGPFQRVTPQVKAHLSLILGAMALLKAYGYYLQRFELNFSTRGVVEGASYTDVHAQLPALHMLIVISVAATILFLVNIRLRGWVLPVIAVGLWAIVSVVLGAIAPAFVQRVSVQPNELRRERPYIERNLQATRAAYNLAAADTEPFAYKDNLTAGSVQSNSQTLGNARLWDPNQTRDIYRQIQEIRPFYQFNDVDVDRYQIGDRVKQVVVSARELNPGRLPNPTWQNRHTFYTHGYGLAVSPASEVTGDGRPNFIVSDIPYKTAGIDLTQPAIYFGESFDTFALVDTDTPEFDFQRENGEQATIRYGGSGGVKVAGIARRAAFALRFGDFNLITTKLINSKSRILYLRNIADRVHTAAPFLRYDHDPYPVVVGGRIQWVLDAYTTTDRYPYAQTYRQSAANRLDAASGLQTGFNYVRNSVKVTIDAYNGTIKFWVIDSKDPMVRAYRKAFPKLFSDGDRMPADLRKHLRYPEDIFKVQTDMFASYHIKSADPFYNRNDQWAVSPDPGTGRLGASTGTAVVGRGPTGQVQVTLQSPRMDPYYLLMRLPGQSDAQFLLLQPFVPVSGDDLLNNLLAFMVAPADPASYGKLRAFVMPSGRQVPGPVQVNQQINNTPDISSVLTLLDQRGSEVIPGSLQLFPVEDSILYIRPYYVQGESGAKLPDLRFVSVFYNGTAVLEPTLDRALGRIFAGLPPSVVVPGGPTTEPTADVQGLLDQASRAYDEAQAALKNGDLSAYQKAVDRMAALLKQARDAAQKSSKGTAPSA